MNLYWQNVFIDGGQKVSRAQLGPWVLEVLPGDDEDGAEWQVFEGGHRNCFDVAETAHAGKLQAEAYVVGRITELRTRRTSRKAEND